MSTCSTSHPSTKWIIKVSITSWGKHGPGPVPRPLCRLPFCVSVPRMQDPPSVCWSHHWDFAPEELDVQVLSKKISFTPHSLKDSLTSCGKWPPSWRYDLNRSSLGRSRPSVSTVTLDPRPVEVVCTCYIVRKEGPEDERYPFTERRRKGSDKTLPQVLPSRDGQSPRTQETCPDQWSWLSG